MDRIVEGAFAEISGSSSIYIKHGPGPRRLLVMSGLPFSGKSHLANAIAAAAPKDVAIVRSDSVRPVVAKHMGRSDPHTSNVRIV